MLLRTILFSPFAQVLESRLFFCQNAAQTVHVCVISDLKYGIQEWQGAPCQELARRMAAAAECSRLGAFCDCP